MASYRISLKYKLALPVSVLVFGILLLLSHTTIRLVRDFVLEAFQAQISAEADTFARTIRSSFFLQNYPHLQARLDGLAAREEVYGAEIVDREGMPILQSPVFRKLPTIQGGTFGANRLFAYQSLLAVLFRLDGIRSEDRVREFPDLFVVASPFYRDAKEYGRLQIFFTSRPVNEKIRGIYRKRILFSFLAALGIAFLTSALTWLAIRPLFRLKKTVQDILKGQIGVRAKIHSFDEIEDLADAFNEMLGRLEQSVRNLRLRTDALEESEEKYRALVENATDVIWLLSAEGKIIFANQGFAGLSREALLREGLPLFFSFNEEDSIQRFNAALDEVKNEKKPVDHVTTVLHQPRTHGEVYYSTNLTPVFTHGNRLKAIQAVSRDVTELKRIEMMKERLIRDVAHELKTPVAKFQMSLNWLEREFKKSNEAQHYRELVDLMKRNADLLMSMIMEIMNLSRLEAGTEQLEKKPCELNGIIKRVCEDIEPLIQGKKLGLEKKLSAQPLSLGGDETMLYRLFSNLLVNAMKFTPLGKVSIQSEKEEDQIRITVKDTGIGLEKEDLGRVFDRFFQKTPATHGMGIGLALAREIVILHGGRIWAESEGLGKGSSFIVEFPS